MIFLITAICHDGAKGYHRHLCVLEENVNLRITVFEEWNTGIAAGAMNWRGLCRVHL